MLMFLGNWSVKVRVLSRMANTKLSDIEIALKELQEARKEIQKLNQIRSDALENVKKAQLEFEATAAIAKESKAKAEKGLFSANENADMYSIPNLPYLLYFTLCLDKNV